MSKCNHHAPYIIVRLEEREHDYVRVSHHEFDDTDVARGYVDYEYERAMDLDLDLTITWYLKEKEHA